MRQGLRREYLESVICRSTQYPHGLADQAQDEEVKIYLLSLDFKMAYAAGCELWPTIGIVRQLLAEHLGCSIEDLASAEPRHGGLIVAITALMSLGRSLRQVGLPGGRGAGRNGA